MAGVLELWLLESGTMKVQEQKAQEELAICELTEGELDAVNGGFLGRLLAPDKETHIQMSNLMVSS